MVTLLGTLGSGAIAWVADVFELTNFGQWQAALIGAGAFFVVSFAANLVRAPFRQRDEARAALAAIQAARDPDLPNMSEVLAEAKLQLGWQVKKLQLDADNYSATPQKLESWYGEVSELVRQWCTKEMLENFKAEMRRDSLYPLPSLSNRRVIDAHAKRMAGTLERFVDSLRERDIRPLG